MNQGQVPSAHAPPPSGIRDIYIRSAYEAAIKRFCDKHHLSVRYCENPKKQRSDDFWRVIRQMVKEKKLKDGSPILTEEIMINTELSLGAVLNQLSHTAPINLVRKEVEEAHKAIKALKETLQTVTKCDLQS